MSFADITFFDKQKLMKNGRAIAEIVIFHRL